ncbi:MAG: type IV pilus modification PilV family protein [Limisphaerales bacterium]
MSSAFTLVEAMVGLAVVAFALVSLYAGITYGMSLTEVTRENLRATQLVLEKFETIRLYTWDQLNGVNGFVIPTGFTNSYAVDTAGNSSGVIYTGTMQIVDAPVGASYSADIKLVTVTINWTSANVPRTRTMETLIARQGLQQYVY